jgi:8-oxo-dGTP diphosphatase
VRQAVVAILLVGGRYALQHRDERPGIAWPGYWTLFGGGIEGGETPEHAVQREIGEELALDVAAWRSLWTVDYGDDWTGRATRLRVFDADVTAMWPRHRLGEGQRADVFAHDALPEPMVPIARTLVERHRRETRRGPPR